MATDQTKSKVGVDLSRFETQISKTGFVLENSIASQLRTGGWTVISNRYYVDDHEETVREIDLVAYKATKVQDVQVYTSLIISCKKSEQNAWALLARPLDPKDPNADWWPLHAWTNDPAINYELGLQGTGKRYHDELNAGGVSEVLQLPQVEVFAFQEMDRSSGAPKNDKPIFDSITSLMKAQSYELTALPMRRKDAGPCLYQFNLLSIADTDLLRLQFDGNSVKAEPIESEHYIARYIVRKKATFSRIRFIKACGLSKHLADYDRLHVANCRWFLNQQERFYKEALKDARRTSVFAERFRTDLGWYLSYRVGRNFSANVDLTDLAVEWRKEQAAPAITAMFSNEQLEFISNDADCQLRASLALKEVYKYEGAFIFDRPEIPF